MNYRLNLCIYNGESELFFDSFINTWVNEPSDMTHGYVVKSKCKSPSDFYLQNKKKLIDLAERYYPAIISKYWGCDFNNSYLVPMVHYYKGKIDCKHLYWGLSQKLIG